MALLIFIRYLLKWNYLFFAVVNLSLIVSLLFFLQLCVILKINKVLITLLPGFYCHYYCGIHGFSSFYSSFSSFYSFFVHFLVVVIFIVVLVLVLYSCRRIHGNRAFIRSVRLCVCERSKTKTKPGGS